MTDSRRKHRHQMAPSEIQFVENFVHKIVGWSYIDHAIDRMKDKRVTYKQVLDTLDTGYVIEVHNNVPDEIRAVIRKDYSDISVCVVVSLSHTEVVTVWWNRPGDRHYTLDLSKYRWHVHLPETLKALNA